MVVAKNGFCLLSNWQLPQLPVLSEIVSSVNGRATIACINDPLEPKLYRHTFLPLAKYSATIFGQKFFPFFNQLLLYIAYFVCIEMLGTERTSGKMHPHTTTNLSVCFWLCFIVGLSLSASLVRSPCNVSTLPYQFLEPYRPTRLSTPPLYASNILVLIISNNEGNILHRKSLCIPSCSLVHCKCQYHYNVHNIPGILLESFLL